MCRHTKQHCSLLLLLASVLASLALPAPIAAQPHNSFNPPNPQYPLHRDQFPAFPNLLSKGEKNRAKWQRLGEMMWEFLKQFDLDFVDTYGTALPPGIPGSQLMTPVACGRIARLWIRMPFHDCGTYNVNTKKGGCNGSLRKEMPSTEPLVDPKTGKVIFKDVFDQLGEDKARADYAFDKMRKENTGFAVSVSFFYQMKFKAEKFGLTASWADIMVYGGLLSVAMCDGPHIRFVPGRVDSDGADPAGSLPAPTDGLSTIMGAYSRMGLGYLDAVATLASHSVACFAAGCLDTTPHRLDNYWAKETLAARDMSELCTLPGKFPADAKPHCYAPMDIQLQQSHTTMRCLALLASDIQDQQELSWKVSQVAGLYGYGSGVFWKVNLCSAGACRPDQYGFFHLFATSYYRMCSLGLKRNWKGYDQAVTGASMSQASAALTQRSAGDEGQEGDAPNPFPAVAETEEGRATTIRDWNAAYGTSG